LENLQRNGIKVSKIHLSSALKTRPTSATRQALSAFAEDVYLHQVVARSGNNLTRFRDLDVALGNAEPFEEWRIHFHIPLQCPATSWFEPTTDHLRGVLDFLAGQSGLCSHLEMETYTWEVLPPELKSSNVVDQLAAEYEWCLKEMRQRGLGRR
jgi:hypothetical protein